MMRIGTGRILSFLGFFKMARLFSHPGASSLSRLFRSSDRIDDGW